MKKGFVTVKDVQATVAKAVDKAVDKVEKALQAAQQAVLGSILPCHGSGLRRRVGNAKKIVRFNS